jgi:hypothetical protein
MRRRRPKCTKLDKFLRENKLKPSRVAYEAGCSRQHLLRLRKGIASATITMAVRLVLACTRMLGRDVALAELFEIEGGKR